VLHQKGVLPLKGTALQGIETTKTAFKPLEPHFYVLSPYGQAPILLGCVYYAYRLFDRASKIIVRLAGTPDLPVTR